MGKRLTKLRSEFKSRTDSDKNFITKDSMLRFGDDLTELILSYLTLEDKIRLECVSKQWQRLVFNKQFEFGMNFIQAMKDKRSHWTMKQMLESLLKKCPNIMKAELITTFSMKKSEVLPLIGRYCPRIKSLVYHLECSEKNVLPFFLCYGQTLEELNLFGRIGEFQYILRLCPNLKRIRFPDIYVHWQEDNEFLPKLEEVSNFFMYTKNINNVMVMSDKYSQTMKTLDVRFVSLTAKELKTCMDCISRFGYLKELKLELLTMNITEPIDNCLSLIGQKCNKLLKLDLSIDESIPISDRFFQIFSEFKAIKKLKIELLDNQLSGSVECFKHCKQLNELDITYYELTEDFFANIALFVPKLKTLRIITRKHFNDSFSDLFQTMKNIQRITYFEIDVYNDIDREKNWYFGKCLSEVMLSPNGMNVKHITHNCGLVIKEYWEVVE